MTIRKIARDHPGVRLVMEQTAVLSAVGKKRLMQTPFVTQRAKLEAQFQLLETTQQWVHSIDNLANINHLISSIHDFLGTLTRLKRGEFMDDLDFFEIKRGGITMVQLKNELEIAACPSFQLRDVQPVVYHLDPENSGLPYFYIYSAYDPRLREKRKAYDQSQDKEEKDRLFGEISHLENQVRRELSITLRQYVASLEQNLETIAELDLTLAKIKLAEGWGCCIPEIAESGIAYDGLFHPLVKERLEETGGKFQPIEIQLDTTPTLITGANMSGKTIFLRSIALAQWMFQLGYFIPAQKARIEPVEEIFIRQEEEESSEQGGLSSFASEILWIDHIIQEVKKGKKSLILVDELARTTNPTEGRGLVSAFIEIMKQHPNFALITTHYSGVEGECRRLRVRGLQGIDPEVEITPETIHQYMDYSLIESDEKEVPHEALTIAQIFKVDKEFLELANRYIAEN